MPKSERGGKRINGSPYDDTIVNEQSPNNYFTVAQNGEVMFVKVASGSVTAPLTTNARGRVYATLDNNNSVKHITFYDKETGERTKQIDVEGKPHRGMLPHTHIGYEHDEHGTRELTRKERETVENIISYWEKKRRKLNF